MEDLWFEEELDPIPDEIEAQVDHLIEDREETIQRLKLTAHGIVRTSIPKWKLLGETPLQSSNPSRIWKVRLRFQFDTKIENVRFLSAQCEAYLEPVGASDEIPTVYDFYPKELYEGEPQIVSIKLAPSLKVSGIEASLGELGANVEVGQIAPVVIGFPGRDDRSPYWQLKPGRHPIRGTRDFWLLLEQPSGCSGIRLRVRAEGIIQTFWGPISVYPKVRIWDGRPAIVIQ